MTGDKPIFDSVRQPQSGAMLLVVMLFLLASALTASTLVQMYQTQNKREKEEQLLFVGDQYRRAIASYYSALPPGGARSLPGSIEDLLNDHRFPTPIRHLRRAYPDPITGQGNWVTVRVGQGIAGVHSRSTLEPFKQSGFAEPYHAFEGKKSYADWVFSVTL